MKRKDLIAAAAAIGLLAGGAAYAQDTAQQPPATGSQSPDQSEYIAGQKGTTTTDSLSMPGQADKASAENMLGRDVVTAEGEEIGSIQDVILNADTGEAEKLVIKSGGFLGMGGKTIALDFAEAQLDPSGEQVQVAGMTADQIKELPEFEYDDTTVSLGRGNADAAGGTSVPPTQEPATTTTTPSTTGGGGQ